MAPKLNSHCWYDMKLAAAKKPDVADENTCFSSEEKPFTFSVPTDLFRDLFQKYKESRKSNSTPSGRQKL